MPFLSTIALCGQLGSSSMAAAYTAAVRSNTAAGTRSRPRSAMVPFGPIRTRYRCLWAAPHGDTAVCELVDALDRTFVSRLSSLVQVTDGASDYKGKNCPRG